MWNRSSINRKHRKLLRRVDFGRWQPFFFVTGVVLFFLLLPIGIVSLFGDGAVRGKEGTEETELGRVSSLDKIEAPAKVALWLTEEEKTVTLDFETYVTRVVASEMPSNFETEALKAQAVAARTYAMSKIHTYESQGAASDVHPAAALCDTTHCQAYHTEKELIERHEEGWEKTGWKKIKKACKETAGELLYYDGKLVSQPLFFSSSGGQTENSEDVFLSAVPYLVSVTSPYEEEATHKNEETKISLKDFAEKMKETYPARDLGTINRSTIKILSRTAGGRVDQMQVGDGQEGVLLGTEVRQALGLPSSLFSIRFEEGEGWNGAAPGNLNMIFTTSGSGHGVGMSQYGADGMAKEGASYVEILKHYYQGTEVG